MLARLGARPNVHAAAIYRADGSLFVAYASADQAQALSAAWLQRAVTLPLKAMTRAVRELITRRDFS